MSKKFLQTSSVLALMSFSLFASPAKAMEDMKDMFASVSRCVHYNGPILNPTEQAEAESRAYQYSIEDEIAAQARREKAFAKNEKIRELKIRTEQQSQMIVTLSQRVDALENPSTIKATLRHSDGVNWHQLYETTGYQPVIFDHFEGDERLRGNQNPSAISMIEIPEDGWYFLEAHYCWHANNNGPSAPYTWIIINNPGDIRNSNKFVQHHLAPGYQTSDNSIRPEYLKRGDKVMLSIQGSPNAEYFLGHFQLDVKKIH